MTLTDVQVDGFYVDPGQRLHRARTTARLTQIQVANAAGLTRSSVANVEAGRQRVPLCTSWRRWLARSA